MTPPTDATATGLKEAIARVIAKADDAFGYSYRMTSLVDDVATHTLFMDGFEPVSFEDRDDGVRLIEERRNTMRATAILALLPSASTGGERETEGMALDDFAYDELWQAIAAATRIEGGIVAISVVKFRESIRALAAPETPPTEGEGK